ncbi:hypothetical protein PAXRUDRAFT_148678 [Paxillus rubicundulus Ve08.2h10]|uniref:Unplaced genomic scaffold scaffold_523, whole genome shotgun sequence n=1 Tax=Paxillus rubicundulus Ve08.2h10 TaxID=930991 RepID=A0A0D0E3V3_9AGAM|nr:hypothetical protein PAXRUDRAFT_148678 [Paxillus rubicundulus Ve08.2h10]
MAMTTYITAQSPMSTLHRDNPYQTLFHQCIDPTIFCPFSCPICRGTYAHVPKEQCRGKFCSHRWKCIMIGYTYRQQAYKLLDTKCQIIISSQHVTFSETRTISTHDLALWNVPTVEGQWEGLLLRQHEVEHEDLEEESL